MKTLKRMAALLLVMVMVLSMATTAYADETTPAGDGTIKIIDPVEGHTYSIYQILVLESFGGNAYSYKAAAGWEDFLSTQTDYVEVDEQGYVTWKDKADPAVFAKAALAYAESKEIAPVATKPAASDKIVEFTGLELGYYLVDTTLGSLCSLNTTDKTASVEEKNEEPTLYKYVVVGDTKTDSNNASIGDTVYFEIEVLAHEGAQNYVIHDLMANTLTFNEDVKVYHNGNEVGAANYTVVAENLTDDCTFHVVFKQAFLDTMKDNDKLTVTYSAVLNQSAESQNKNKAWMDYGTGDDPDKTTPDETITYTFDLPVFKFYNEKTKNADGTEEIVTKKALAGAGFTLYTDEACTAAVNLVQVENSTTYNVCTVADCNAHQHKTEIVTDATGKFTVHGLAAGTYYLKETTVPAGYNQLTPNPKAIVINNDGKVGENLYTQENPMEIENKAGTRLPSTGGVGTTMFYAVGGFMVLAAVVLLITKRRMAA